MNNDESLKFKLFVWDDTHFGKVHGHALAFEAGSGHGHRETVERMEKVVFDLVEIIFFERVLNVTDSFTLFGRRLILSYSTLSSTTFFYFSLFFSSFSFPQSTPLSYPFIFLKYPILRKLRWIIHKYYIM